MLEFLSKGTLIGIGATAAMDVWAMLLRRLAGQNLPNWALVGRWFWHLRHGQVFHDDIAKAEPYERELVLGWAAHYLVGCLYGVTFLLAMGQAWLASPTLLAAWIFGIVTVGAGWFLLQPGMGSGWAASKTANPTKVRVMNLAAHTSFALGLWGTALALT